MNEKTKLACILFITPSIGMTIVFLCTPWGIGLAFDSAAYLFGAKSLLNGNGLRMMATWNSTIPMTIFPPVYSAILALMGLLGLDLKEAARYLNIFLFGANLFLVGFILWKLTESHLISMIGSFLALTSFSMLISHFNAFSEPLFLFFTLSGLLLLGFHTAKSQRSRLCLIMSAAAIALAALTRYIGVSLIATGLLALFFLEKRPYSRKLADILLFLFITCCPLLLWFLRNHFVAHHFTARPLSFYPLSWNRLVAIPDGISSARILLFLEFLFIFAGLFIAFLILSRKKIRNETGLSVPDHRDRLASLIAIFILSYTAILLFSMTFVDATLHLQHRYLAPISIGGMILTLFTASRKWHFLKQRNLYRLLSIVTLSILCVANSYQFVQFNLNGRRSGHYLACRECHKSPVIREVKDLPFGTPIYSNWPTAIYLLAGRSASHLPRKNQYFSRASNPMYAASVARMEKTLQTQDGVIVYFRQLGYISDRYTQGNKIDPRLKLRVLFNAPEGSIYQLE